MSDQQQRLIINNTDKASPNITNNIGFCSTGLFLSWLHG